jgi:hypothetical protein
MNERKILIKIKRLIDKVIDSPDEDDYLTNTLFEIDGLIQNASITRKEEILDELESVTTD